ncbi:MAG: SusD/RagB family nutrient-binding outer membrane lipoprotein [Ginsengibacter sp.]
MKKVTKYILGLLVLGTLAQSCKKQLVDINTNPNSLPDAAPEFLFAGATVDINLNSRNQTSQKYGTTMTYMQYVVPNASEPSGIANRYWVPGATDGPNPGFPFYNEYFTKIGRDMHRIVEKIDASSTKGKYQGLKGICIIVDTYHAWRVADIFGALPYEQAFKPQEFPLPEYDFDYTLYKTFDQKLKEAATLLTNPAGQADIAAQDLFFGGDYAKWLSFANTLRIKIAQRYEKRDPAQLTAVLNDVATNFNKNVISSIDGSFGYKQTQSWNNNVDDINVLLFNYSAAFPFVEFLKSTNDPRINFMVRKNDFGSNYKGYTNVEQNGNADSKTILQKPENKIRYWGKYASPASVDNPAYGFNGGNKNIIFTLQGSNTQSLNILSSIQTRLFLKNGGFGGFDAQSSRNLMHDDETYVDGNSIKMWTPYLTYAETCFMMAEIAEKGMNAMGKSASDWFYEGVKASFDQYKKVAIATNVPNATTVTIGNFATTLPYKGLPSIYSQAWVDFLMEPTESWAMWKRTGYPQYTDVRPGSNGKIGDGSTIAYLENLWDGNKNLLTPRRSALQLSSGSNPNSANYAKAIQAMIAKSSTYGTRAEDTKGRIWWDAN